MEAQRADMESRRKAMEEAASKAAAYVNIKPRTRLQVEKYLREKGYDEESVSEAVKQLMEYRYIDDAESARLYFEYGFSKGRGEARIRRELADKGVSAEDMDIAYDELEEVPDPVDMAMEIGRSMMAGTDIEELDFDGRRKLGARIGRRLMSRGFSPEVAYKVIGRLLKQ